jgi:hypothetical protein
MEETALKIDLIDKIEHADFKQLKELYGLVTDYFNTQGSDEGSESLPAYKQQQILKGLAQADAGLGTSLDAATRMIRTKYALNG